jgi:hypothetical protein
MRIELLRSTSYDDVHRILDTIAERYQDSRVDYTDVSLG